MAIEETNHIERVVLAFRGDVDGSYKGAHVEKFSVIRRDGVEIARQPGKATTIAAEAAAGFTMPAVAAEINLGLILTNEAQAAQISALETSHAATLAEKAAQISALTAERDQAVAAAAALTEEVAALNQQLAAYQTPVVNGVPQQVTRRQARQALRLRGLLELVQPAIDAIPDPLQRGLMQDEWDDSLNFERQRPSLIMMAHAIGLTTDAQIDDLFVFAAGLV